MKYLRFDPSNCGFPKPRLPVLPTLTPGSLRLMKQMPGLPVASERVRHFARGRYALMQAYRLAGVGSDGALLAPAYHCRTMLDPAIRLGAHVTLYPVKADLSPDLDALAACLNIAGIPPKALLVPHYFGFAQSLAPLVRFCSDHEIALIEDCSHALAGPGMSDLAAAGGIGKTGHYCVSSPYKFFPSADGGLLWSNGPDRLERFAQRQPGIKKEIRGLVHTFQKAVAKVQSIDPEALADEVNVAASTELPTGKSVQEDSSGVSGQYQAIEEDLTSLAGSRWIFRHTDMNALAMKRRRNYQTWLGVASGLPGCKPLFPHLPDECVPYMFPLVLDHPETYFHVLKRLGVPIWRWDDMAVSDCAVATSYRIKLLHVPCHQAISAEQIHWMTAAFGRVLSDVRGVGPS